MSRLSNFSAKKAIAIFQKFGYIIDHQTGSHIILFHPYRATLSIPNHKELAVGLLCGLIKKSGLTVEEFLNKE